MHTHTRAHAHAHIHTHTQTPLHVHDKVGSDIHIQISQVRGKQYGARTGGALHAQNAAAQGIREFTHQPATLQRVIVKAVASQGITQ